MRDNGYYIANVLADIDPRTFTGPAADREQLSQIVIERFLMQADQGWVFRGAYGYRGALQAEDEEAGAHALVLAMLADPAWRDPSRFLLLREAARVLPIQTDDISATAVRQEALDIAEKDPAFTKMRIKIHGSPDAADAAAVREYASSQGKSELAPEYARLAEMIDELYSEGAAADSLERLAENTEDTKLAAELRAYAGQLDAATDDSARLRAGAANMYLLRKRFQAGSTPDSRARTLKTFFWSTSSAMGLMRWTSKGMRTSGKLAVASSPSSGTLLATARSKASCTSAI